jgi:hypothetical protein
MPDKNKKDQGYAIAPECFDVKLEGQSFTINTKEICQITDVGGDMTKVSAQIAFYGKLVGAAEKTRDRLDAAYRSWKSNRMVETMAQDPKLAEWKVKAIVEAKPEFAEFKAKHAEASSWVTSLYWLCRALSHKAEILRSLGATQRSEADATGMTTRTKKEQKT